MKATKGTVKIYEDSNFVIFSKRLDILGIGDACKLLKEITGKIDITLPDNVQVKQNKRELCWNCGKKLVDKNTDQFLSCSYGKGHLKTIHRICKKCAPEVRELIKK